VILLQFQNSIRVAKASPLVAFRATGEALAVEVNLDKAFAAPWSNELTRCSLGYTSKCPIDTGLAELGAPHDFRDRRTICPQGFHLLNHGERQYRLGTEPNASRLRLVDSILDGDQEDVMTDDVEERLDEIEQSIVAHMGERTKRLYLAFKKKGGNLGDVIDLVMEEQFRGFGRDVDDHLAEMFETFLSEHK
jgi:hypothetical protein